MIEAVGEWLVFARREDSEAGSDESNPILFSVLQLAGKLCR